MGQHKLQQQVQAFKGAELCLFKKKTWIIPLILLFVKSGMYIIYPNTRIRNSSSSSSVLVTKIWLMWSRFWSRLTIIRGAANCETQPPASIG